MADEVKDIILESVLGKLDTFTELLAQVATKYGGEAVELGLAYARIDAVQHIFLGFIGLFIMRWCWKKIIAPTLEQQKTGNFSMVYNDQLTKKQRHIETVKHRLKERTTYLKDKMTIAKNSIVEVVENEKFSDEEYHKVCGFLDKSIEHSINDIDNAFDELDTDLFEEDVHPRIEKNMIQLKLWLGSGIMIVGVIMMLTNLLNIWAWFGLFYPDVYIVWLLMA